MYYENISIKEYDMFIKKISTMIIHQTWHCFSLPGFIGEPTGQLKSLENSSILEKVPCSRLDFISVLDMMTIYN